ncbi:hypothetical protein GQF03_09195 [Sneathiella chungangensis]|uniref:Uncharacterized protein n=1 Tax=Sneathiella chungangensis TaxID=1418234 RepID=A0A845MEV6_9PROT|nr:hypothetical protein [Sneathiella chungangensis]MZR22508.1 hypothetical protein [Sneathiella chungangensis]
MAARDRFTINITCNSCGNEGEAEASENDYPFMRHPGFRFDALPEGIIVIKEDNFRAKTVLKCQCGNEISP